MRHLLGLLIAALLLTGCGGGTTTAPEDEAPSTPESGSPTPIVPKPGGDTPEGQPPIDGPLPDTRTGNVVLKKCFDSVPTFGFDGTVTAIDGGRVTFEVHESFFGDVPETFTVDLGGAVTAGHSEASPSYSVGTRLLVQGAQGRAGGCGDTVYWDEATAAAWRS